MLTLDHDDGLLKLRGQRFWPCMRKAGVSPVLSFLELLTANSAPGSELICLPNRGLEKYSAYLNLPEWNRVSCYQCNNHQKKVPKHLIPMKRTILQYRTGTLHNQKHAVRFKRSTNPFCPLPGCHQLDSALHMLSGCKNHISSMKTERHNVAGRMIIGALSKSPWGAGLVNINTGSDDRLAQHNLKIPTYASNRIIPPYLFPRNSSKRSRLTSSRPDVILIAP
eukprot:1152199-Pelagomonas_calceolata.AAC.2